MTTTDLLPPPSDTPPKSSATLDDIFEEVRRMRGELSTNTQGLLALGTRLSVVEEWKGEIVETAKRHSLRVKEVDERSSQQDLRHEALIAAEEIERKKSDDELRAQIAYIHAIAIKVAKVMERPAVKIVGALIALAITTYFSTHGIKVPE